MMKKGVRREFILSAIFLIVINSYFISASPKSPCSDCGGGLFCTEKRCEKIEGCMFAEGEGVLNKILKIGECVSVPGFSPSADINRDIMSDSSFVGVGCEVPVKLSVNTNGNKFYVIEEDLLNGLDLTDNGGGNTSTAGKIKWAVYSQTDPPSALPYATYTYKIRPLTPGIYSFNGIYTLGDNMPHTIGLDDSLEVIPQVCGDGNKTCDEQCDDGNQISGDGCSAGCERELYYNAFVSSQIYNGNLSGLSGADARCVELAKNAGMSSASKWKAWMSDSTQGASSRLYHSSSPYRKMNNELIATNWNGLISSSILSPINIDEHGNIASGTTSVWTGTYANGEGTNGGNCGNWTSTEVNSPAYSGNLLSIDGMWSFEIVSDCRYKYHLYCFEQPWCGNGFVEESERCDDGNTNNGDGCSSSCTTETGAACGNGVIETGEQCDDGNTNNGDGCSSNCIIDGVPGPVLSEPKPINKNRYISFVPGNAGKQTAIRVNLTSLQHPNPPNAPSNPPQDFTGYEGQYRWVGPPNVYYESKDNHALGSYNASVLSCSPYYTDWGNFGIVHVTGAEIIPSSVYDVQAINYGCSLSNLNCYSSSLSVRTARWGDIDNSGRVDGLDSANAINAFKHLAGAPLKVQVQLQPAILKLDSDVSGLDISSVVDAFKGFAYPYHIDTSCGGSGSAGPGGPGGPSSVITPACTNECSTTGTKQCSGDGYITCGNYDSDSCLEWSSITSCSSSQACSNGNCISTIVCGNGILEQREQCDDGNRLSGDGCSSQCLIETKTTSVSKCGNNIIENGETCDGNIQQCIINGYSGTQTCNAQCNGFTTCQTTQYCGDGSINGNEQCDDGNLINGDGCSSACLTETKTSKSTSTSKGEVSLSPGEEKSWFGKILEYLFGP